MTDTAKPSCPELVALGRIQQLPGVPHDHLRHRVDPFDGDNAAPEGAVHTENPIRLLDACT